MTFKQQFRDPKTGLPKTQQQLNDQPRGKGRKDIYKETPKNPQPSRSFISLVERIKLRLTQDEQFVEFKNVEVLDDKMKPTGKICSVRIPMPNLDAVAMHYLAKAQVSDKILIDLMNRIDGYPVAKTESKTLGIQRIEIVRESKKRGRKSKKNIS